MAQRRPRDERSSSPESGDAQNQALQGVAASRHTRVLIADPIDLARQGLRGLLSAQQDLDVVASCRTTEDTAYESMARCPDVVLIGYGFSEPQRLETVRRILEDRPSVPVIVVADRPDLDAFLSYVRVGVRGYLGGNVDAAVLAEAVRTLSAGGCTIEPTILEELFVFLARINASTGPVAGARDKGSPLAKLSRREREVLRLMAQGMRNKEIASSLGITAGTVKTHLRHIFRKLHVCDRTGAVLAALEIDPRRLLPAA
ncbi:MAG TPA: response regulator transcription factor [Dehalococcoidia bacterium]|nr:response regulator transcription factor [Dehalococcoidia bacterium]